MNDVVLTNVDPNGVATLTINRPEAHNAINDQVVYELITALDDLAEYGPLRALWLNSFGKDFCSGTDPHWLAKLHQGNRRDNMSDAEQLSRLLWTLYHFPTPTLVTVQGFASGPALGLICCADIVLACDQSSFAVADQEQGVVPAVISPYLIRAFGERKARFLCFSGRALSSFEAQEYCLVDEVCERATLNELANQYLQRICQQDPQANRSTKSILHYAANETFDEDMIDTTVDALVDSRQALKLPTGIK